MLWKLKKNGLESNKKEKIHFPFISIKKIIWVVKNVYIKLGNLKNLTKSNFSLYFKIKITFVTKIWKSSESYDIWQDKSH